MTDVERAKSTEESAAGLSADIRSIYGQGTGAKTSPYAPAKPAGTNIMNFDRFIKQMVGLK